MSEPADLTVGQLLDAYRARRVSPVEALESCLGRMERLEPMVGAVLTLCVDNAYRQAEEAARRWSAGKPRPLEGIPYGLKDIIETAGIRTTGGSRIYEFHVPTVTASLAARLDDAGAVLVAKLQTFEFAAGATAVTSNPWDITRTAAGSSSGSAAALAARELPLTVGTDTGGSVAIPASFCGITGLKPTFGRIPRHGIFPVSWTLDHACPMARTAYDAALALAVMAGHDPRDPSSATVPVDDYVTSLSSGVKGMRIGVPVDWFFDVCDPAIAAAAQQAVRTLESEGAIVVEIGLPSTHKVDLHAMENTIIYAELASLHSATLDRFEEYGPEFRKLLARAQFVQAVDYLNALRARHLIQQDFEAAFEIVDVILVPGAITVAPRHDHLVADLGDVQQPWVDVVSRTTAIFNMTGIPSISIPSGFSGDGLPIGIQIAARPYDEKSVLRAAHTFQHLTDHHERVPELVARDSEADHAPWSRVDRTLPDERAISTVTQDSSW